MRAIFFILIRTHKIGATAVGAIWLLFISAHITQAQDTMLSISGQERVLVQFHGVESLIQSNAFLVKSAGTNWSIETDWTVRSPMRLYIAFAGGDGYSMTSEGDGASAGALVGPIAPILDAAPQTSRILFLAFVATPAILSSLGLSNLPAPFLDPRHPVMWSYHLEIKRLNERPFLPNDVHFTLNPDVVSQLPQDAIDQYSYTHQMTSRQGRKDLEKFVETQKDGATYEVTAVTNISGFDIPLNAKLKAVHWEKDGVMARTFEIVVTNIAFDPVTDLRPPLAAHTDVQQVVDGSLYLYAITNGDWLLPVEARRIGTKMSLPGRPPPTAISPRSTGGLAKVILLFLLLSPLIAICVKLALKK